MNRSLLFVLGAALAAAPSPANALTDPVDGAVRLPEGFAVSLPYPEGVRVRVSCGYGPDCSSYHVNTDRVGWANDHYALDLVRDEAGSGDEEPVTAIASGTVLFAAWSSGGFSSYGRIVIVEHDFDADGHRYWSLYAHLSDLSVSEGDRVDMKEEVGLQGGSSDGACGVFGSHVHLALYQDAVLDGSAHSGHSVVPEPIDGYEDLDDGVRMEAGRGVDGGGGDDEPASGIVVDDLDREFRFLAGDPDERLGGGWGRDEHFSCTPARPEGDPALRGRWTPPVPETALYRVQAWVPVSECASSGSAPYGLAHSGGLERGTLDQSSVSGAFADIFGGEAFKLALGSRGFVELHDATGEASGEWVAFDAIRLVRAGDAGDAPVGAPCSAAEDCAGTAVCVDGLCVSDCTEAGCPDGGACDLPTGLCTGGDADADGDSDTDSGWDGDLEPPPPPGADDEDDGPGQGSACRAGAGPVSGALPWVAPLLLAAVPRRRRR